MGTDGNIKCSLCFFALTEVLKVLHSMGHKKLPEVLGVVQCMGHEQLLGELGVVQCLGHKFEL